MNTRAKGQAARRDVIRWLEGQDYCKVGIVERADRFASPKDLFGLFDLAAYKLGSIAFVQVACGRPHAHAAFSAFKACMPDNVDVQQFVKVDREGWKLYVYNDIGYYARQFDLDWNEVHAGIKMLPEQERG